MRAGLHAGWRNSLLHGGYDGLWRGSSLPWRDIFPSSPTPSPAAGERVRGLGRRTVAALSDRGLTRFAPLAYGRSSDWWLGRVFHRSNLVMRRGPGFLRF